MVNPLLQVCQRKKKVLTKEKPISLLLSFVWLEGIWSRPVPKIRLLANQFISKQKGVKPQFVMLKQPV